MFIRKYQPADGAALAELFYDTVHTVNAKDYAKEQLDAWAPDKMDLKQWDQSFQKHYSLVAVEGETVAGFGDIDEAGYLDRLYVHRDYQGRGIGSRICTQLEQAVSGEIITHASITARPFFEKRGYRMIKEQQVERRGVYLTNYVMRKELPLQFAYSFRPISEADDPLIAKIIRYNLEKAHLDIPGTAYFDPELDHLSAYYEADPVKRAYLIAENEAGEVIGGVGISDFSGFENCGEIQKLYLSENAKGKGIGKALMWAIQNKAGEMGYESVYLETHSNLKTAIHLYEKLGFYQIERPRAVLHTTMDRFYKKELTGGKYAD